MIFIGLTCSDATIVVIKLLVITIKNPHHQRNVTFIHYAYIQSLGGICKSNPFPLSRKFRTYHTYQRFVISVLLNQSNH